MPLSETAKKSPRLQQLRWKKIPSSAEWSAASKSSRFSALDRRGSDEIRALDAALSAYGTVAANPKVPLARESEALIALFEAIEVYLATPRRHSKHRLRAVHDLRAIALFTLSDIRWQKYKDVTGGHKHGMKPMIPHVWSEKHSPDHARVGHGPESNQDPDPWLRGEAEEKYLFEYLRNVRAADGGKTDGVRYIEDEDRWNYQIVFRDDGMACERFVKQKGVIVKGVLRPITTSGGDLGTWVYAVDENDVFYTEVSTHSGQSLNHCSFLAGRPVKCAGMIGITNGVVGYIDNGSGHYRPSRKNLVNCLEALKDLVGALNFQKIIVRDHSARYSVAAYSADKFLAMHGRCLPIGFYKEVNGRYDEKLNRFQSKDDARLFFENQEKGIAQKELEKRVKDVIAKIEWSGKKGKLASDEERDVFKLVILQNLMPLSSIGIYFKDDDPMQEWLRRRAYNTRIPV